MLAIGFFGDKMNNQGGNGVFYRDGNQVGVQFFAALIIILWVVGVSVLIFLPLRLLLDRSVALCIYMQ